MLTWGSTAIRWAQIMNLQEQTWLNTCCLWPGLLLCGDSAVFYQSIQGCGVSHSCQFNFLCSVISSPVVLLEYFMFNGTAYSTTALWVSFLYLLMKLWLKDIIIYCLSHPHLLFVFLRLPERRLETTVTLCAVVMMYPARWLTDRRRGGDHRVLVVRAELQESNYTSVCWELPYCLKRGCVFTFFVRILIYC